jgi:hypothetical protein
MKSLKCSLYFLLNAIVPTNLLLKGENGIQELQYQIEDENLKESHLMIYEEIL